MRENATTEAALVQGYSGGPHISKPEIERCACGTEIVCVWDDIPIGVLAHNATTGHLAWRDAGGMEAHLERLGLNRGFDVPTRLPLPPGVPGAGGKA